MKGSRVDHPARSGDVWDLSQAKGGLPFCGLRSRVQACEACRAQVQGSALVDEPAHGPWLSRGPCAAFQQPEAQQTGPCSGLPWSGPWGPGWHSLQLQSC